MNNYMSKQREEVNENEEEGITRTSFKIPLDILNDYKHLAIDKQTTVTELFIDALKQYLRAHKK
jgi:hypothetical protein